MKALLKRVALLTLAASLSLSTVACSTQTSNNNPEPTTNLSLKTFSEDLSFKTWADRPPTPSAELIDLWKEAGLTHFNMTEDDYVLTNADGKFGTEDDGVLNPKYLNALDLCEQAGLEVLIRNYRTDPDYFYNDDDGQRFAEPPWNYEYYIPVRHLTNELTSHNAVAGYYMGDEPSYQKVGTFDKLVEWYNQNGGNTLWHMNLLQSYAPSSMMRDANNNLKTYAEYVRYYCDQVLEKVNGPKTLGTDYYPLVLNGEEPIIKNGILSDYVILAENVNRMNKTLTEGNKVALNLCIQVYNSSSTRDISSLADITFQTNLAAAFGTKSLQYYLFRATSGDGGMIDMVTQKPTPMYGWVKEANIQMQVLADVILNFDYVGVKTFVGAVSDENNVKGFGYIQDQALEQFKLINNVSCRLDTVVSEMADKDGNVGYMVVNFSEPSKALTDFVKVYFSKKVNKAIVVQDGVKTVVDVNDDMMQLTLGAGSGAFVYPVYEK